MTNPVEVPVSQNLTDRYRLDQLICNRTRAQAWRGFDVQSQRAVIVKVFKPEVACSIEQLKSIIQRLAQIQFPGLAPILDHGTANGSSFLVYEPYDVGSLRDYVRQKLISTQQITRWIIDLGESLEIAHAHGLVHGGIKPTNALIDVDGQAVLSDLGIFPPIIRDSDAGFSLDDLKYVSPEQLEGKLADARSDLYSLGVVLHELLTGRLPYRASDLRSIRFEILRGATPDSAEITYGLRRICRRSLARDPDDRYQSAEKLVNDLRRTLTGASTRRWAVATVGVALFIVGFGVSSSFWEKQQAAPRVEQRVDASWIEQVQAMSAREQLAVVAEKLKDLNPGFDGNMQEAIENDKVTELMFSTDYVRDLTPLRALSALVSLTCFGSTSTPPNGKLFDLRPLQGLPLKKLAISNNERIIDLSPLSGMPLEQLDCGQTSVTDLSPLNKTPLAVLICRKTNVTDLSPLRGTSIRELYCDHTEISNLTPLEGTQLQELHCEETQVANLAPLRGLPLKVLDCYRTLVSDLGPLKGNIHLTSLNILSTKVTDLSPIRELPNIKLLWCDLDQTGNRDLVQSLKTLRFINDNPVSVFLQEESSSAP